MKKIISLIIVLSMIMSVLGAMPLSAVAATSGTCGDALTWTLDDEGTLTISGTGAMTEWSSYSKVPWYSERSSIKKVVIGEGVTSISTDTFYNYDNLTEVVISSTVKAIYDWAFASCDSLKEVTIPPTVDVIGMMAFYGVSTIKGYKYSVAEAYANADEITFVSVGELPETVLATGECGEGVTYSLTNRNVLTISGKGATAAYEYEEAPWFAYMNRVQKVVIEKGITAIGDGTFNGLVYVNDITIPEGVTSIGEMAFYGCWKVESLTLPSTLVTIGNNAFNSLGITELIIPEGVTTIGEGAFLGAPIESVTIPESVVSIGQEAFGDGVTSLVITGVKGSYAEEYANENGYSFAGIIAEPVFGTCGENLTWVLDTDGTFTLSGTGEMETWANHFSTPWYDYEESMTRIVIENGVKNISGRSFYSCSNLQSATISYTVTDIGSYAFYAAPSTFVIKGYTNTTAESYANNNGYSFESLGEAPCYEVASGTCGDACAWSLDSYGVLTISGKGAMEDYSGWYSYKSSIKEVVIEEAVTAICSDAFESCSGIEKITLPDSLTSIGDYAFADCTGITEVILPDSLTSIGEYAFVDCYYLQTVTVPASVGLIGDNAFLNCNAYNGNGFVIKGYSPSAAETFATENGYTFESLGDAPVVTVASGTCGENLTWTLDNYGLLKIEGTGEMSYSATGGGGVVGGVELMSVSQYDVPWYSYWQSIKKVEIGEGVTSIEDYAFYYCTYLEEAVLPESLVSIGYYAFAYCQNLNSVNIHYNVNDIDNTAFTGTSNVVIRGYTGSAAEEYALYYSKEFVSIGEAPVVDVAAGDVTDTITWSLNNRGLLTITGTGDMPEYDYNGPRPWDEYKDKIKAVEINGVDTVTQYSVSQCNNLTSVVLNDVKTVESYAIYSCYNLAEVTIPQSVEAMGSSAFGYYSFTIKGIKNSYAEMYANHAGKTFEAIEGELEIKTVYVSTVDELVAAIGSNTEIIMEDGIYLLDKTAILGDVEYTWEYADALEISNVMNLTIKARNPGMVEIISSQNDGVYYYSYENAPLHISGAYNLVIEGIRIGNMRMNANDGRNPVGDDTELMGGYEEAALPGYNGAYITPGDSNGVGIPMQNKVSFIDCDIFNCTYAIYFSGGSLTVDNCTIRDNVKGAISAYGDEIVIKDSVFSRNGSSTNYKGTYCLDMSGTVTDCTFINNGNESYTSGSLTESGNVFSNNTWNGETAKAYGVTKNGITWQVSDDSGEAVLKLGYTVNADNIAIESKTGTVYPYSVNSLPWAEYEIYTTDVNAGVVYDELIWGGCGKDAAWQYEPDTKTLTISGSGAMSDIGTSYMWADYYNEIENIVIADTITGVYNNFVGTAYYGNEENWENGALYIGDVLLKVKNDAKGKFTAKEGTRVIADEAFINCALITEIVLPETVEHIGVIEKLMPGEYGSYGVFSDCTALTSLTIPAAVKEFDHVMVNGCDSLADVYYTGTKAQWGAIVPGKNNAEFEYCTIHCTDGAIEPIKFLYEIQEDGVVITGVNPTIADVTVPAEIDGLPVKEIGSSVFTYNKKLKSVVIEAAVEQAPYFTDCENLESVVFPESLIRMFDVFEGCSALESITLGDNITYMSADAFDGTAYYKNPANWDGGILYVDGYAVTLSETAPEKITLRSDIRGTSYGFFNNNSTVKEIVVPDGAKLIADGEFLYNMSALESITLPDTFEAGGYNDFGVYQCEKLTNVNISANNPNYVSVDGVVFTKDKTQLVYMPMGRTGGYTIPDGVTTIQPGAFSDTHLSSVTIPASVTYIEYSAFPYSYYLSDVYYNITVEEWENLENIYIGGSNMAFNNANLHLLDYDFVQDMLEYELSDDGTYYSVAGVKSYATEITIPAEYNNLPVRDIVPYALYDAKSLECINVEENNLVYTSVDGVLFTKDMTTVVGYPVAKAGEEYNLPETVRVIGNSAFRNNKNLKTVNLNSALENIGTYTFESSNIESIKITENVTTIGFSVFYNCKKLEKVYMGTNVRTIEDWAFDDSLKYIYFDGSQNDWYSISGHYYVPSETKIVFAKIDIEGFAARVDEEAIVIEMSYAPTTEDEKVFIVGCGENGESLAFTEADAYNGVLEGDKEVLDEVEYVKIFVWESLESMRPMGEPVLIPIE